MSLLTTVGHHSNYHFSTMLPRTTKLPNGAWVGLM
jgi:hypothetical protein